MIESILTHDVKMIKLSFDERKKRKYDIFFFLELLSYTRLAAVRSREIINSFRAVDIINL